VQHLLSQEIKLGFNTQERKCVRRVQCIHIGIGMSVLSCVILESKAITHAIYEDTSTYIGMYVPNTCMCLSSVISEEPKAIRHAHVYAHTHA